MRSLRFLSPAMGLLAVLLLLGPAPVAGWAANPDPAATAVAPVPSPGTEILWDRWGVPHIVAPDEPSLFYAFGWAQMRNHGNSLLSSYGVARGRGAEYFGAELLAFDRAIRTMGLVDHARDWYAQQPPDFRANLDAFAAVINAYGSEHPQALAPWTRAVLPVDGVDVLASAAFGTYLLAGSESGCVDFATGQPVAGARATASAGGSSAWAVAPARSASGNALLLANPHFLWPPSFAFFEAQLTIPGAYNLYGATTPGSPVLTFAFNDNHGWTLTVNTIDICDLCALTLADGGYEYDGEVRPFETRTETLSILGAGGTLREETLEVRRSVHGPVFEHEGGAVALRMAPFTEAATAAGALAQYWEMGRAQNLAEFETALARLQEPMFTIVYADRDGHILSLFNGQVPVRPDGPWDWTGILPGDTSATLWTEVHPYDDLPKVVDPPGGWVQNSNSPPWYTAYPLQLDPDDYPPYMAPRWLGWREVRGIRMLEENPAMSLEQMVELKHSTRFELADRILDDLIAAARDSGDATAGRAADVLAAWDREANPDSTGALLFAFWFIELGIGDPRVGMDALFATPPDPAAPLTTPNGLADPESAVAALIAAAEQVEAAFGRLDVPWGEVARLRGGTIDEPANGFFGDPFGVFRVLGVDRSRLGAGEPLPVIHGDSYIAAVEFGDPVRAYVLMTYGNATQPGSPHIGDQLALAARAELRPAWLTRAEVEANLEEREVLEHR